MSSIQRPRTPEACVQYEWDGRPTLDELPELGLDAATPPHEFLPLTPNDSSTYYEINDRSSLPNSPCISKADVNLRVFGSVSGIRDRSGFQAAQSSGDTHQAFKFELNGYLSPYTTTSPAAKPDASTTGYTAPFNIKADCNFSDIAGVSRQTKELKQYFGSILYQSPINSQAHSAIDTKSTVDDLSAVEEKDIDNDKLRPTTLSDCVSNSSSSTLTIATSQLHSSTDTSSTRSASFRAAVRDLSSILPYETFTRLKQDSRRCVYTNLTGMKNRCGNRLRSNEHTLGLIQRISSLGSSYTLTDAVALITEIIAEFTCRQGTHRGRAVDNLQNLLNSLPTDLSRDYIHLECKPKSAAQIDIDALFQWFTAITTCSPERNAAESNAHGPNRILTESQTVLPALNKDYWGNTTHQSTRHDLKSHNNEQNKSTSDLAVTLNRQIQRQWPSIGTAIGQNFIPYQTRETENSTPAQLVHHALLKSLTPVNDHKDGYIYMYWITGNFGYCKIGVTTKTTRERLRSWQRQCGHQISSHNLIGSNSDGSTLTRIPHVYRVEKLVHTELHLQRRRETGCEKCGRWHKEWFEVDAEHAKRVVNKWSQWMVARNPYDTKPLSESEIEALCQPLQYEAPKAGSSGRVSQTRSKLHGTEKTSRPLRKSARIAARAALDEKVLKAIRESLTRQNGKIANIESSDGISEAKESGEEDNEEGGVKIEDEHKDFDVLEDTKYLREWNLEDS